MHIAYTFFDPFNRPRRLLKGWLLFPFHYVLYIRCNLRIHSSRRQGSISFRDISVCRAEAWEDLFQWRAWRQWRFIAAQRTNAYCNGLGAPLDTICDLASYVLRAVWTATATLGRFRSPRYCPSFRKLHIPYFSRTMPRHKWKGLCKPFFKDDGYHCFPGLHVRQTCRPSNMSGIWLVGDLFVRVLQHLLLTFCGLAHKLRGRTFPRKISSASFIPCHDA